MATPTPQAPVCYAAPPTHSSALATSAAPASLPATPPGATETVASFSGKATYYSDRLAGRRTASGSRYNPREFTAAHRTLPFGTIALVTRLDTPATVRVTITDRGPFGNADRIIDLSKAAAVELKMLRAGVVPVRVDVLRYGDKRRGS